MSRGAEQVECPKCHTIDHHGTAIRQVHGLVDVGWLCTHCNYEWGFEVFKSPEEE